MKKVKKKEAKKKHKATEKQISMLIQIVDIIARLISAFH